MSKNKELTKEIKEKKEEKRLPKLINYSLDLGDTTGIIVEVPSFRIIAIGTKVKRYKIGDQILTAPYLGHILLNKRGEHVYTYFEEKDVFAKAVEDENGNFSF